MNPLLSIKGTIISGFALSAVLVLAIGGKLVDFEHYLRWLHYLSGITWIGLLYYFNFVQLFFQRFRYTNIEYYALIFLIKVVGKSFFWYVFFCKRCIDITSRKKYFLKNI